MYTVTDKFRTKAYSGGAKYRLFLTIGDKPIDWKNVTSLVISDPIVDKNSETMYIGSFISTQVEIQFRNYEDIDLTGKVKIEIGMLIDDDYEKVPIGEFNIETSPEDFYKATKLVALDNAVLFKPNVDISQFFDMVIYTDSEGKEVKGITLENLMKKLGDFFGVEVVLNSECNKDHIITQYDNSISGKQHISWGAELMGCNAKAGRDGKIYLIPLKQPIVDTINAKKGKSFTKGEKYRLGELRYDNGKVIPSVFGLPNDSSKTKGKNLFLEPYSWNSNVGGTVTRNNGVLTITCSTSAVSGIYTTLSSDYYKEVLNKKTITLSFYARADKEIAVNCGIEKEDLKSSKLTNEWQRFSQTVTNFDNVNIRQSLIFYSGSTNAPTFQIKNIQVEIGNKATYYEVYNGGINSLPLSNSLGENIIDYKIEGTGKQKNVAGNQLFDASLFPTKTIGGVTLTNNGDGSFTISGSDTLSSAFSYYHNYTHEETLRLLKTGTITLNYGVNYLTKPYVYFSLITSTSTVEVNGNHKIENITQAMLDDTTSYIRVGFYALPNSTTTKVTIKPMVYQNGNGTWEEFVGGNISPNPDYPQEIKTIKGIENLLNITSDSTNKSGTKNGITWSLDEATGIWTVNGTTTAQTDIFIDKNGKITTNKDEYYTLSSQYVSGTISTSGRIYLQDGNHNWQGYDTLINAGTNYNTKKYTYNMEFDGTKLIRFWNNTTLVDFKFQVQFEKGNVMHKAVPYGNYLRVDSEGKNLFPKILPKSINGITLTQNDDSTYDVQGTSTVDYDTRLETIVDSTELDSGATYTLSVNKPLGSTYVRIEGYNNNTWVKSFMGLNGNTTITTKTIDLTGINTVRMAIVIPKNVTVNLTNISIMLEKGTEATEYQPYQASKTSYINMKTPITTPNIYDKDNPNIINGYFDASKTAITLNSVNKLVYVPCEPNTTYELSKIQSRIFVIGYTSQLPAPNVEVSGINFRNYTTSDASIFNTLSITTGANASYLAITYYNSTIDTLTEEEIRNSIEIHEDNSEINELCSVYSAGSNSFIKDELEVYDKVTTINKKIKKVTLDGTENWYSATSNRSSFTLSTFNDKKSGQSNFLSDKFIYKGNAQTTDLGYAMSFNIDIYKNHIYIQVPSNIVPKGDVSSFKTWLSQHPTTVYYELDEPYIVELKNSNIKTIENGGTLQLVDQTGTNTSIEYYNKNSANTMNIRTDNMFITGTDEERNKLIGNIYEQVKFFEAWNITTENYADISHDSFDMIRYILGDDEYPTFYNGTKTYKQSLMSKIDVSFPTKQVEKTTNVIKDDTASSIRRIQTNINDLEGTVETIITETIPNATKDTLTKSDYVTIMDNFNNYAPNSTVTNIQESVVAIQSSTYTKTQVNNIVNGVGADGQKVTYVETVEGTFDKNGLTIEKTGSETKGNFNNEGLRVINVDQNGNVISPILEAIYDKSSKQSVVRASNLQAKNFLMIDTVSRFQNYRDENGQMRTGCFWINYDKPIFDFDVTNGTYYFVYDASAKTFTSNNQSVNSSTATTTLTVKTSGIRNLFLRYTVNSETNYDKFSMSYTHLGTTVPIATDISGADKNGNYTIPALTVGDTILMKYVKDGSQNANGDTVVVTFVSYE